MILPENNFAFIDSQNLNIGIQQLGWRLDFRRFRVYLKEKFAFMDVMRKKLEYRRQERKSTAYGQNQ